MKQITKFILERSKSTYEQIADKLIDRYINKKDLIESEINVKDATKIITKYLEHKCKDNDRVKRAHDRLEKVFEYTDDKTVIYHGVGADNVAPFAEILRKHGVLWSEDSDFYLSTDINDKWDDVNSMQFYKFANCAVVVLNRNINDKLRDFEIFVYLRDIK